ncbi:MAG: hypothetical protein WA130_05575 [Candidatus Methanoperedens sp.]
MNDYLFQSAPIEHEKTILPVTVYPDVRDLYEMHLDFALKWTTS